MNKYITPKYLSRARLMAFVEQYNYIEFKDNILEIGFGSGVFGAIANRVANYKSMDIDISTGADYISDITKWKAVSRYKDKFNIIFCCQVLEHIPFSLFETSMENIKNLNAGKIVISLPDNRKYLRFAIKFPGINIKRVLTIPFYGIKTDISTHPEHHWEIYYKNIKEVKRLICIGDNYRLISDYRLYDRPSQHFFIFCKS